MLALSTSAQAENETGAPPPPSWLSAEEPVAVEASDTPADYPEDFSTPPTIAPVAHNAFGEEEPFPVAPAFENSSSAQVPE